MTEPGTEPASSPLHLPVLGPSNDASQKEIQRAYRKLARKYHPDVNKGKTAEEKFKQINEANEVLKDSEKKNSTIPTAKTGNRLDLSHRHIGKNRGFHREPVGRVFPEHFISAATVNSRKPKGSVIFLRAYSVEGQQTGRAVPVSTLTDRVAPMKLKFQFHWPTSVMVPQKRFHFRSTRPMRAASCGLLPEH